ncbi:hypothetical protein D9M71_375480 [compost metagenome]
MPGDVGQQRPFTKVVPVAGGKLEVAAQGEHRRDEAAAAGDLVPFFREGIAQLIVGFVGLATVFDRLVGSGDFLLHDREDLAGFFPGGGKHGQRIKGGSKTLDAFFSIGAIGNRPLGNAIEVAAQSDDLAVTEGQAIGQVQGDFPGWNRRAVLAEAQQGVVADGGVFAAFKTQHRLAAGWRFGRQAEAVVLDGVVAVDDQYDAGVGAGNLDAVDTEQGIEVGDHGGGERLLGVQSGLHT